jgi:hypothetical protein
MANTPEELQVMQLLGAAAAGMPVLGSGLGVISASQRGPLIGTGLGALPMAVFTGLIVARGGTGVLQDIRFYTVIAGVAVYLSTCGMLGWWVQRRFR